MAKILLFSGTTIHQVWLFSMVKTRKTSEVITVQAGIMCEIVFQLLAELYYRLSLILEQKYRDTDKSITRGKIISR